MRKVFVLLTAALLLPSAVLAVGTDIYNTMGMIQVPQQFDAGNGNAKSGMAAFGAIYDLRLADDFIAPANLLTIVEVEQASESVLGVAPQNLRVLIYEDQNNLPKEPPIFDVLAAVTMTPFTDYVLGWMGQDLKSTGLNLTLPHAGKFWIDLLPVDTSPSGDWFWQVRDLQSFTGSNPAVKDGVEGNGGYGFFNWQDIGPLYGAGDAAMRIAATPEPTTLGLLAIGALFLRRR